MSVLTCTAAGLRFYQLAWVIVLARSLSLSRHCYMTWMFIQDVPTGKRFLVYFRLFGVHVTQSVCGWSTQLSYYICFKQYSFTATHWQATESTTMQRCAFSISSSAINIRRSEYAHFLISVHHNSYECWAGGGGGGPDDVTIPAAIQTHV